MKITNAEKDNGNEKNGEYEDKKGNQPEKEQEGNEIKKLNKSTYRSLNKDSELPSIAAVQKDDVTVQTNTEKQESNPMESQVVAPSLTQE